MLDANYHLAEYGLVHMTSRPFIIDGVAHAYDFSPNNRVESSTYERNAHFAKFAHQTAHVPIESTKPGYLLTREEWSSRWHAEDLASTFFVESDVDMIVHHHVEIETYFRAGASRFDSGLELKRMAPDRVLLYGCVDTFGDDEKSRDAMSRMAEQGVSGFKFYPSNGFYDAKANGLVTMFYDTPDRAYKFFEKARSLGVRHLAFHKAQPIGPGPIAAVGVEDISSAAMAFPDMTFEIVHDGYAFLEQSAWQLTLHPNIYANLECVVNLVVRHPMRFAHIIGTLLQYGGAERIIFATGCAVNHPDPIISAFLSFKMPRELIEGYGYPELTDDIKSQILGRNMARLHGIDIEQTKRKIASDRWSKLRAAGKAAPWSAHRKRLSDPNLPESYRGYANG
jgi:predicted TIM-barrel fold metal-dependent hydrolase